MAILKSGELSFDFRYTGFEDGYVRYQICFLWKDEPIVKDQSLKRWNEHWNGRPESTFTADEYEADTLLPFLRKVLDEDIADYWKSLDPDIMVAIYPDEYFPFLKSHYIRIYESEESQQKRKDREALKKEKGKLPDDCYTFIAFVDAYNFKDADAYYGQGFSMNMIVNRHDLEEFASQLEKEYSEFKIHFKLDEYFEEND